MNGFAKAYPFESEKIKDIKVSIDTILKSDGISAVNGDEAYVYRINNQYMDIEDYIRLKDIVKHIGVTSNFKEIIDYFDVPKDETPAGFRLEYQLCDGGVLRADLARDISYDKNSVKRPTNVLFSADSANPYEISEIKNFIANLTCNPGIVYDLFINNPKANVGNKFKNRDEVMEEIGRILGPGVDISVEINNPFASNEEILEEAEKFREMLSKYRVVIKVPHTGPVNGMNVHELLEGDKKFHRNYDKGSTGDMLRGHNLAIMLREHGYRVNFTLMFEGYQTAMALQARPYFINSFIRHRQSASIEINNLLKAYKATEDRIYLEQLKNFMMEKDILCPNDKSIDLLQVKEKAQWMMEYRKIEKSEGKDGLDGLRHNLRVLKQANLADTRLIICSMDGERNYPEIDKLLQEDEFREMTHKVVITAEPQYLAKFTSSPLVVSYQRRFMNAANGQK